MLFCLHGQYKAGSKPVAKMPIPILPHESISMKVDQSSNILGKFTLGVHCAGHIRLDRQWLSFGGP